MQKEKYEKVQFFLKICRDNALEALSGLLMKKENCFAIYFCLLPFLMEISSSFKYCQLIYYLVESPFNSIDKKLSFSNVYTFRLTHLNRESLIIKIV